MNELGIPGHIPPGNPVISPVSLEDVFSRLDERDSATQARATSMIRRWALGLVGIVGVPIGFQYWETIENDATAAEFASVQLAETREEIVRQSALLAEEMRALTWVVIELKLLSADGAKYLGRKLDRVHRRARAVKMPDPADDEAIRTRVMELLGPNR